MFEFNGRCTEALKKIKIKSIKFSIHWLAKSFWLISRGCHLDDTVLQSFQKWSQFCKSTGDESK
jgi:hypothetical protein